MLKGIVLQAHPTQKQKKVLSQWIGCARFIWNAKCDENHYQQQFAKRYLPDGTYPNIDQTFSQYKNSELSPWLYDCPSQILRNSASNWYSTYRNFIKGLCGKPSKKRKFSTGSIHLTSELFRFEKCSDGVIRLFIGTKRNNIGYLSIKNHKVYEKPNSIRIKRKNGRYYVSFCYEDQLDEDKLQTQTQYLGYLKTLSYEQLEEITIGVDRGVKRPVQAGGKTYDFTIEQKRKKEAKQKYIKRCQRSLFKKKKGSKRSQKKKQKLARAHEKICNIRKDFCHKTSRSIVNDPKTEVIILEDLNTKNMSGKPKPKKDEETGKYLKNNRKQKAGLNRSILDIGWHQLEVCIIYKSYRAGKTWFKISANYTSQECADCGHTHPDNRKSQEDFCCKSCGNSDNADHNAEKVIKKRAINLILHSGTELSSRGVLLDIGRGAKDKTQGAKANCAYSNEASKKKRKATIMVA